MDYSPFQFISKHTERDLTPFKKFYYRTFNGSDCTFFLHSLQNIYQNHNGLEGSFNSTNRNEFSIKEAIENFRNIFFRLPHEPRTQKHLSNPAKNSSCKRLNLFLRWMVRKENNAVTINHAAITTGRTNKDFRPFLSIEPSKRKTRPTAGIA